MIALLNGLIDFIDTNVPYLQGRGFISPSEGYMPNYAHFPFYTVKDGDFDTAIYAQKYHEDLFVDIMFFADVPNPDDPAASVLSQDESTPGVLKMAADVKDALLGVARPVTGYANMQVVRDMASSYFGNMSESGEIEAHAHIKLMTLKFGKAG